VGDKNKMNHYHGKCKRTPTKIWKGDHSIKNYHCEEHDVDTCFCGWEWGHHYGTDSKSMAFGNKSIKQYRGLSDEECLKLLGELK
jgi:hypothetical protein